MVILGQYSIIYIPTKLDSLGSLGQVNVGKYAVSPIERLGMQVSKRIGSWRRSGNVHQAGSFAVRRFCFRVVKGGVVQGEGVP